jgi:hypothetical protein
LLQGSECVVVAHSHQLREALHLLVRVRQAPRQMPHSRVQLRLAPRRLLLVVVTTTGSSSSSGGGAA